MPDKNKSKFLSFLAKIPVWIKAIVIGVIVYAVGSYTSLAALQFLPPPFSLILLAIILFLYIKYFSGRWGRRDSVSAKFRIERFRAIRLSGNIWKWGIPAVLLFVVAFQAMFVVTFRLFEYQPDIMLTFNLSGLPLWLLWTAAIASALIAGVTEEIGFRGYMMVPIAKRYNPWTANIIVSAVFLLFHLNQGWAQPSMFGILFIASFMFGMLAIGSGSLIPGIIAHFIVDIFNFSYWWSNIAGSFEYRPISETGIDAHFLMWSAILIVSMALFIFSTHRMNKVRLSTGTSKS